MTKLFTIGSIFLLLTSVTLSAQTETTKTETKETITTETKETETAQPAKAETETTKTETGETETVAVEVQVCSAILERLPVDTVDIFPEGTEQLFAWCHVIGAIDSISIWIDWYHGDELKAEVELPIKSSNWRTWSSKRLLAGWTGEWEVRVLDAERNVLRSVSFYVGEKPVLDNE